MLPESRARDSSVGRMPVSCPKGHVHARQERRENFLLQSYLSVADAYSHTVRRSTRRVTAVARKSLRLLCQKCGWQVTTKHVQRAPLTQRSRDYIICAVRAGKVRGPVTRNSSGNARPQSFEHAAGNELSNFSNILAVCERKDTTAAAVSSPPPIFFLLQNLVS